MEGLGDTARDLCHKLKYTTNDRHVLRGLPTDPGTLSREEGPVPFAPIHEGSVPFALDGRVGGSDFRERNDFDGRDLGDEDGNVLEIKDYFNIARLGKRFTVS